MSNNNPITPSEASPPETPVTPTVTYYQQLANDFMKSLDTIAAVIPKLEASHVSTTSFVRSHANIPTQFIATSIAVVEQTPVLQRLAKFDVDGARNALQFLDAFHAVCDKVMAFEKSLKYTLASTKAVVAKDSLRNYSILKTLAKDPGSADLGSHVANLKRDLGKRGRPRTIKTTWKHGWGNTTLVEDGE
jgi:hypothetical protein